MKMCGILAYFHNSIPPSKYGGLCALKPRGPDGMILTHLEKITLGFTHLRINGNGSQPMSNGKWWVLCNGEIFNHVQLEQELKLTPPPNASDCWILPYMFEAYGFNNVCDRLDGEFAIIAYNSENNTLHVFRDPYGIRPLFIGRKSNAIVVASELKAMKTCSSVDWVKPGMNISVDTFFNITKMRYTYPFNFKIDEHHNQEITSLIRTKLISAVKKRCMSDKPIAALLSGGLDSSIICSILKQQLKDGETLNTFSIGMEGSTDLKYARIMADYLESNHHEIIVTKLDILSAIPAVINDIESYDVTTVRASVGNWMLGRYIRNHTNFKVVFNGDGSDELFGGYLYFNNAPSDQEFESEIDRLLSEIHMFDVLRSDRSMSSHGLEARTPFLDKDFAQLVRRIPTHILRPTQTQKEKFILREAFKNYLPHSIYTRRKEAFSDGVNALNTSWFSTLVNEREWYYSIYRAFYEHDIIPHMWMPKWCPETDDPSARTLNIYNK